MASVLVADSYDSTNLTEIKDQVVQSVVETDGYSTDNTPTPPATGNTKIEDYILIRTIGVGSLARVHLAKSKIDSKFYAVKSLNKELIVSYKQVGHVKDEISILGKMNHPMILSLDSVSQDSKFLFMVLEFVEGGDLFTLISRNAKKTGLKILPEAVRFFSSEIFLAIEYLHSFNIIHRDINPENIAIDAYGHVKLIDFGLANQLQGTDGSARTFCGKRDYLAPEIIKGTPYGKGVDWWSFGIIIFEMLCGYPPFYDKSVKRVYQKILTLSYKFPSFMETDIAFQDLLSKIFVVDSERLTGQEIKDHHWADVINWKDTLNKTHESSAKPNIQPGVGDAKYFDKFPEDGLSKQYGNYGPGRYDEVFNDIVCPSIINTTY